MNTMSKYHFTKRREKLKRKILMLLKISRVSILFAALINLMHCQFYFIQMLHVFSVKYKYKHPLKCWFFSCRYYEYAEICRYIDKEN